MRDIMLLNSPWTCKAATQARQGCNICSPSLLTTVFKILHSTCQQPASTSVCWSVHRWCQTAFAIRYGRWHIPFGLRRNQYLPPLQASYRLLSWMMCVAPRSRTWFPPNLRGSRWWRSPGCEYLMPPSTMYCPSNFPNASEPGLACLVMTVSVTRITPFCSWVKSPPGPATIRALALGTKIESCT